MGENITITASDDFTFDAYLARPDGSAKGGLVVIQEIFGVNQHMREVCDGYAADGYVAVSPALFDRYEKNIELGYESEDVTRGREIRSEVGWDDPVVDMAAAVQFAAMGGKVGTVGYCWGGSLSFLCATRIDGVAASICYYGGQVADFKGETANAALMMHFGAADASIPPDAIEAIRAAQPAAAIHVYDEALHGFNCDHRGAYHEAHAATARVRTLEFLEKEVAG
ncbi:MAG: carboxymethylenebutenolidase [Rhodospirillaceae bacterium]|nr:carboxymethylenebutenolidase [Rhodospirillaceae bacterium]HAA93195.1 carboxymethylenebutenolidase [Rhodospirillaceae bacterium]